MDGFFYISASHNPVGHNGLKMGLDDGGVAGGEFSAEMIRQFRRWVGDTAELQKTADLLRAGGTQAEARVYRLAARRKRAAAAVYSKFTREVAAGPGPDAHSAFSRFRRAVHARAPGVIADMNGSARSVSIDAATLSGIGCRLRCINDTPGSIAHQILPEGDGLQECVRTLAEVSGSDPAFILGYVPDNDGDRGNLVVSDAPGRARPLEAQEVFALAAVAELSWLHHTSVTGTEGTEPGQRAIVVNGPTSMRIDRIAHAMGFEVHRAEVGEANVVSRARELRDRGYAVRFLGEGSNGGNITHPSAVRDPIQTILAVLKLLYTPDHGETPGPGRYWLELARRRDHGPVTLGRILESLPRFTTTSAFDPLAKMQVRSIDHGRLKSEVERLWENHWPQMAELRDQLAVTGFQYENYEGTVCKPGKGNRTEGARGGFKILLRDEHDVSRAFLWMRGSGTEPVFRVMVDVEGDQPELERRILGILREIVSSADDRVCSAEA